ncbi:MAG: hypothetical protein EOO43_17855 [Flavobacterium sp.]|nr:MAG: hypothetical protein EOO43_17855 [Flavobacterium sp.]
MASVINIPQVVRGRPNYNNEIFSKQSDISYNSECRNRIEFGRFNQKGEPLFYASLPTEKKTIDYVLSCALECCKELTFGNNNSQDITIGGWTINQPFPVLNLCFDTAHLHENATLAKEMQKYIDTIDECFSFEAAKFIKNFLYYFSELSGSAASSDYHYFSTTALFHAIRYYYYDIVKEPKFGLIYPGAMSEKKGLNIVLTCDAVNRFLSLDKVVMYRYYLLSGTKTYIAAPCSDIAYPKNGEFLIQNYRRAIY